MNRPANRAPRSSRSQFNAIGYQMRRAIRELRELQRKAAALDRPNTAETSNVKEAADGPDEPDA